MRIRALPAFVAALALAGCSTLRDPQRASLDSPSAAVRGCAEWFAALDEAVDEAGVRDGQEATVSGFPYLRASRLLASFRGRAAVDEAAFHALADRMAVLDLAARAHEFARLPRERISALAGPAGPDAALARSRECGRTLREADFPQPGMREEMLARLAVPDDYSAWRRALGLYPLTRYLFAAGVRRWEEEVHSSFRGDPARRGVLVRHAPPSAAPLPHASAAAILARAASNPLGIPEPQVRELEALFAAHAPTFDVDVTGDHDRFGELRWLRGDRTPTVDASRQVVYRYASAVRYRDRTLLQLVYTIWFPERPPSWPLDLLAGRLDGVVWRVTLAPDGEPLLYDTMHPCGCFHMFFPTPRAEPLPAPDDLQEWLLIPQVLPRIAAGERARLRVASRTHYVERVSIVRGGDGLAPYELRDYDELRSLPRPDGGSAGVFAPDGLIDGTGRLERFLFWPSGIASPGAMRQRGRHATAFVGRRHFDDPDLLERRFRLDLN